MAEQPFTAETFSLAGLRFRLARHDDHLRVLSVAPPGAVLGPDPSAGWLWQRTPALVHVRGGARMGHHGARCVGTQPSVAMKLARLERGGSPANGSLAVELADPDSGLRVVLRYASCGVKGVVSATLEARNDGEQPVTLEQLMLCLPGLGRTDNADWPATTRIHAAKSCWFGEAQWYVARPSDLGIADTRTWNGDVTGAATWRNIGTWTTANDLPMVVLEDRDSGLSWFLQIETSGSWQMEVGRMIQGFYLAAGGPSLRYGDWSVTLAPGESVQAAPVAFGCVVGRFEEAIAALQGYRRKACLPASRADRKLPLFFNDYMNCLKGNPTLENEVPMIDVAAAAGAEYYVIDAGWFEARQAGWGTSLGDWKESPDRFAPKSLRWLCDYIRSKGMQPGLWAEIECVSRRAEVFGKPDSWFLCANGHRVLSSGRYFFNFANPQVRAYCHEVFDRLVRRYGIGYVKLDYNADAGAGDNQTQPSLGAGQIAHTRGFWQFLDEVRARHPDLIIENCASGGQRLEYGMLRHAHVQSTSDQTDFRRYPSIMAGCLAAGLPEQMCIWSYPLGGQDDEAVCMNLVTPMLARWHLSGRLDQLSPEQFALVRHATGIWKTRVRKRIPKMVPFWPLPWRHLHEQDAWLAAGLRDAAGRHAFVTVFRLNSRQRKIVLPLDSLSLERAEATMLFPTSLGGQIELNRHKRTLTVDLPKRYSARLIEITHR